MRPEPPRTPDDERGWRDLLLTAIALPLGVLLLVPLALVVAGWFYAVAMGEGLRLFWRSLRSGSAASARGTALPPPHRTQIPAPGESSKG